MRGRIAPESAPRRSDRVVSIGLTHALNPFTKSQYPCLFLQLIVFSEMRKQSGRKSPVHQRLDLEATVVHDVSDFSGPGRTLALFIRGVNRAINRKTA